MRKPKKKAFTLIEILIAISILGMVLLSIYRIVVQDTSLAISQKNKLIAISLIQNLINQMEMGEKPIEIYDHGDFKPPYSNFHYEINSENLRFKEIKELPIKHIKISVSWEEKGKKKYIEVETFIPNTPIYAR
jgi:prepilin-type N-terminal cleavage/methylation domain-containing protein